MRAASSTASFKGLKMKTMTQIAQNIVKNVMGIVDAARVRMIVLVTTKDAEDMMVITKDSEDMMIVANILVIATQKGMIPAINTNALASLKGVRQPVMLTFHTENMRMKGEVGVSVMGSIVMSGKHSVVGRGHPNPNGNALGLMRVHGGINGETKAPGAINVIHARPGASVDPNDVHQSRDSIMKCPLSAPARSLEKNL